MVGHGEKFTRKQEQAIAHLLTAATIAEAAQQTGIGEQTLLRWLKDAGFQAAYREARYAVVQQAITQAQQTTREAMQTFRQVMADQAAPASARVAAARMIMEIAIKGVAVEDFAARLTALEQRLDAQEGGHQ